MKLRRTHPGHHLGGADAQLMAIFASPFQTELGAVVVSVVDENMQTASDAALWRGVNLPY
jgi:hypothetical protein